MIHAKDPGQGIIERLPEPLRRIAQRSVDFFLGRQNDSLHKAQMFAERRRGTVLELKELGPVELRAILDQQSAMLAGKEPFNVELAERRDLIRTGAGGISTTDRYLSTLRSLGFIGGNREVSESAFTERKAFCVTWTSREGNTISLPSLGLISLRGGIMYGATRVEGQYDRLLPPLPVRRSLGADAPQLHRAIIIVPKEAGRGHS